MSLVLMIYRKEYPAIFTSSKEVQDIVYNLTPILAVSIAINNIQPVLSGNDFLLNLTYSCLNSFFPRDYNFVLFTAYGLPFLNFGWYGLVKFGLNIFLQEIFAFNNLVWSDFSNLI